MSRIVASRDWFLGMVSHDVNDVEVVVERFQHEGGDFGVAPVALFGGWHKPSAGLGDLADEFVAGATPFRANDLVFHGFRHPNRLPFPRGVRRSRRGRSGSIGRCRGAGRRGRVAGRLRRCDR